MPKFFDDTCTVTATKLCTAHTTDSGHTWIHWAGATPVPSIYTTSSGVMASGSTSAQVVRSSVVSPTAGVVVAWTHYNAANGTAAAVGACARLNDAGTAGYAAIYHQNTRQWSIYRFVSSTLSDAVRIGSLSAVQTLAINTEYACELTVTDNVGGTGVDLVLKFGGATVLSVTDTDSSRVTATGYIGAYFSTSGGVASQIYIGAISGSDVAVVAVPVQFNGPIPAQSGIAGAAFALNAGSFFSGNQTPFSYALAGNSGLSINSSTGAISGALPSTPGTYSFTITATDAANNTASSGAVTLTVNSATATVTQTLGTHSIARHSAATWSAAATGTVSDGGTYSGFTPDQVQLVNADSGTVVVAWTAVNSATGDTWSHTFTNVPQGKYRFQLRASSAPTNTVTTTYWRGVGVVVLNFGQSQSSNQALSGDGTLTPSGNALVYGDQYNNTNVFAPLASATMNGYIAADLLLSSVLPAGTPILFVNAGYPGIGLVAGGNGQWLPTTSSYYTKLKAYMTALGGKADAAVHIAGESDANAGVTQANYYAGLGTIYGQLRTDLGQSSLPIVLVMLGKATSYWTDANGEAIKRAMAQKAADANILRVESYDAPLSGDNLHRAPAGMATVGRRWARAVAHALGAVSGYRSPRITSAAGVTGQPAQFDLSIAHGIGSDFTPTTGITGIRATDSVSGSALTVSSAVRQSATTIRVTLSAAPSNLPAFAAGYGANTAANIADNSALSAPLEYEPGITATEAGAGVPVSFSGSVPAQSGTVSAASPALALAGYFSGSLTPFTYSLASGALPPGLTLNASSGQITGTPTTAGSYTATVRATDSGNNQATTSGIAWTVAEASSGGGAGWGDVLSNGLTAGATLVAVHQMLTELHKIHGLLAGSPLVVTGAQRSAGGITQSIAESSGTVTVTRQ